ncbi:MAG: phosphate ABC transporter, permease protein PstA [Hyphomicrobium sp.]|nr:phosphate ABC transporter, permease protein PstA [Hyphomicrobium sp.]PPC80676.1 MAG: phosphate ABC transporter, permease protein PstA [Hyphomicrobium sp.]PPD28421.1 MAG: phosphate ABC transporter, permease protein PstA [Hyphomicrobium sp.]
MADLIAVLPRRDLVLKAAVHAAALVVALAFAALLWDVIGQGLSRLSWSFLTTEPRSSGRLGGIAPIIISTVLLLLVAITVATPLAIGTAVLLVDFVRTGSLGARIVSMSLDILAGVPSIVFGLFGNAFFAIYLGLGFSILSGGLTLACMALPIMIRSTEIGLRAVPDDWRRGTAALGMTKTSALRHILLPAAAPAIIAGLMLGIGRAAAETAALVFTSGYVDRMPGSLFDSGRSIAVHIYDLTMNVAGGEKSAYAAALVLVGLLVIINAIALALSHHVLRKRITQ